MDGILDCPNSGFGVVAAMQIVAGAHFEDDTLRRHARTRHVMSSRTTAAALAMTVILVPASLGISNPPSTTLTVPVPCGRTARTVALPPRSEWGTPTVTSTCIESTGNRTASPILSEL